MFLSHLVLLVLPFAEHTVSFPRVWSPLDTGGWGGALSFMFTFHRRSLPILCYDPTVRSSCGIFGLSLLESAELLTLYSWCEYGYLLLIRSCFLPLFLFSRKHTLLMFCYGVWICICKLYFLFLKFMWDGVRSWFFHVFILSSWARNPGVRQNV